MKLLDEIRQQPHHIRKIFMWSMVAISFSIVGLTYVNSTKKQIVALMNPQDAPSTGEPAIPQRSPFALIGDAFSSMRANISELIGRNKQEPITSQVTPTPVPAQKLP